jgi:hypothetical protein
MAPPFRYELRALSPMPLAAGPVLDVATRPAAFADRWEADLRIRERELADPEDRLAERLFMPLLQPLAVPAAGEKREFNVLNSANGFDKVSAVVRTVTPRAIIYVDTEAESAFTEADLRYFGELFDDPIYATATDVFGQPSDIDGNQRVIILFTPRVNALTPRTESSFVTGFFYGCDLVDRKRCSGTNSGEIFYSLVPDPAGKWSGVRSHAAVRAAVPPIMAHEFQHMINFARRGFSADALWLSEALAHTAEELVGEVLIARGENALGRSFNTANLARAQRFLSNPAGTTLVEESGRGAVEMRGAAWLFLRHVRGHYGGHDLLRRLTGSSTRSGVANVVQETARPWTTLLTDFGVALWADGAPELQGPLEPRYRFVGFDLRTALAGVPGGYNLRPTLLGWHDFAVTGSVGTGSSDYFLVSAPTSGIAPPLNFVLSGTRGAPVPETAGVLLTVLRVR